MASLTPEKVITLAADFAHLSIRPLPNAPTGYYDWEVSDDPVDKLRGHSVLSNGLKMVDTLIEKGGFKPDPTKLAAFADTIAHPRAVDDRQGAFAEGLGILARLDPETTLARDLNDAVIGRLYDTFPHPPASFLGPNHNFRSADGGGNNLQNYDIGRAGMPYSRSVQGKAGLPRSSLPDAGLVFDTLLKRRGHQDHAGGMSSLIFAFATIVTHSLFRTDTKNPHINNASSYFDLSPLYGDNQAAQDKVRDKASGRGLLYPDTFSEERLTFIVPATSALLVLFSRNHNFIAEKILKINERKTWSDPPPTDVTKRALQDEEIFQTAKLVNCGHFINAILGDYVAGFLGSSQGCNWEMAPFDIINDGKTQVERGKGNHISAEFNILYRWHSTLSEKDEQWTNDILSKVFDGKPFDQLTLSDLSVVAKAFGAIEPNPAKRTFAGLKRRPDGKYSDDDLGKIINDAIESPGGAYRARGTPSALRLVEMMGIEQTRQWGLCTMNEFRKFLGLKEFETFEEWNSDPKIAEAARRLYGHVDNLEFYPGIHAESTMPVTTGSQLAAGYTLTRAVLGDALVLIRGDRYYTTDFTPHNLTAWGFRDCQRDMNNGGHGSEISKLLLRHLPRHTNWHSVYSVYPFFTPGHMKKSLARQGLQDKYSFERPNVISPPKVLNTLTGIRNFFKDTSKFKYINDKFGYGPALKFAEIAKYDKSRGAILQAMFPNKETLKEYVSYFSASLKRKIKESTWSYDDVPGKYADVVKSIIYPAVAHVVADKWAAVSLKTKENPRGIYTELEIFDMLTVLFDVSFLAFNKPETLFSVHEASLTAGSTMDLFIKKSLADASVASNVPGVILNQFERVASVLSPEAQKSTLPLLKRLLDTKRSHDEIAANVLDISVSSLVYLAHATANMIDFYLDEERKAARDHIAELVKQSNDANDTLLRGYVTESLRLRPQYETLWGEATVDATIDQGDGIPAIQIKAGDRVRANLHNAQLNPTDFPNPTTVDPRRAALPSNDVSRSVFRGSQDYIELCMVEALKAVFSLKNVRRAAGPAGNLQRFKEVVYETDSDCFIQRNGTVQAWPGSMNILFDA